MKCNVFAHDIHANLFISSSNFFISFTIDCPVQVDVFVLAKALGDSYKTITKIARQINDNIDNTFH